MLREDEREIVDLLRQWEGGGYASDLALHLGLPPRRVQGMIARLRDCGAVTAGEKKGGRLKYFAR